MPCCLWQWVYMGERVGEMVEERTQIFMIVMIGQDVFLKFEII